MKFTESTRGAILGAMRCGVSHEAAAQAAGVDPTTLWRWVTRGREDLARAVESEYATFTEEFLRAEAKIIGEVETSVVHNATKRHDQHAAAWWLSKKRPGTYGKDSATEIARQCATELLDLVRARCPEEVYQSVVEAIAGPDPHAPRAQKRVAKRGEVAEVA